MINEMQEKILQGAIPSGINFNGSIQSFWNSTVPTMMTTSLFPFLPLVNFQKIPRTILSMKSVKGRIRPRNNRNNEEFRSLTSQVIFRLTNNHEFIEFPVWVSERSQTDRDSCHQKLPASKEQTFRR